MTEHSEDGPQVNPDTHRSVTLSRIGTERFRADNGRGGEAFMGSGGLDPDFTPVELFLASIAGCAALTVEAIASKRTSTTSFEVTSSGEKIDDQDGHHLTGLQVSFNLTFPDGPEGDAARASVGRALQQTQARLCSVSKTVELGEQVVFRHTNP